MPRLNLTNFETVCCIASAGSFGAAALRLNASQPAVTARVRELESSVGIAFFQKRGRRMELTIEGREFIRRVEPLVRRIEGEMAAYAAPGSLRGVVRLGIPHVMLSWFPQLVASLREDMPHVRYEIDVDVGQSMVQKLETGRLDIAVVAGTGRNPQMDAISLTPEESQWLMSARVPRRRGGKLVPLPELLGSVPIWLVPRSSVLYPVAMAALHQHRSEFDNINACTHMVAILELIHRTGGIGLTASSGSQGYLEAGLVEPVSPELPPILLDVTLLCHKDQHQPVVRQTIARIVEYDRQRQRQEPAAPHRRTAGGAGRRSAAK